jgi:hypothetical protein
MRVMTAHKILIGTATIFFLFYAGWEVRRFFGAGDVWALLRALAALAVAVALGVYFAYLARKRTVAGLADGLTKHRRSS